MLSFEKNQDFIFLFICCLITLHLIFYLEYAYPIQLVYIFLGKYLLSLKICNKSSYISKYKNNWNFNHYIHFLFTMLKINYVLSIRFFVVCYICMCQSVLILCLGYYFYFIDKSIIIDNSIAIVAISTFTVSVNISVWW